MPRPAYNAAQEQLKNRLVRLHSFSAGALEMPKAAVVRRKVNGKELEPNTVGLAERNSSMRSGSFSAREIPTGTRNISDAQMSTLTIRDAGKLINGDMSKLKMEKASDYIGTYFMWNGVLQPEYDMREPHSIVDTEVYVKQATARKLALASRAGYEIMSDRQDDADYIQHRIDIMEFVMDRTFSNLLKGILRNLFLCSNCFVHKLRKEDSAPVSQKEGRPVPVAGYSIIPAHTIHPYLKEGKIVKWRRFFDHGVPFIDYPVEDIIHFKWDVKPGHIYGTPRTIAVRDDIFALRRLEENIELLFINHLFPLFHVQVGNEKAPCTYGESGESEIDMVRYQIENMPKEGVFVTDERVSVAAVGAEGKSLEFKPLVDHFKSRVYIGLGMSAIDMGEGADATRATADNISQNLKDAIKADLDEFADQIRMYMFKEWMLEANYSTSVQKAISRTFLTFHELDLDNRIKEETHVMALFNSHLITHAEARKRLKYKPMEAKGQRDTHFDLHVLRLEKSIIQAREKSTLEINAAQVDNQKALAASVGKQKRSGPAKVSIANASASKGIGAGRPRSGADKKTTSTAKAVGNKMRPTNQHGTALGPTKAKSSLENMKGEFYEGLMLMRQDILDKQTEDGSPNINECWRERSGLYIDETIAALEDREITGSTDASYTRQVRDGLGTLRSSIAETSDPELLSVLINTYMDDEVDHAELLDELAHHAA